MRLVILGTGPFAVPLLRELIASGHEIAHVVCRPPHGRRGAPPAPVRAAAEEAGLSVWMPASVNLPESQERLAGMRADLLVVCDYGEILRRPTLAATRLGGVNLHGSLLPRYRGAAPVQWAVLNGESETGVTVIHMTPALDAGPILGSETVAIDPEETAGELEERLARLGAPLTRRVIDQLQEGAVRETPQDDALQSRAPRLTKQDGLIDWSRPAAQIKNHVRAMQPWPRTYTFWRRGDGPPARLNIDRVAVGPETGPAPPGAVVAAGEELIVAAGEGAVRVLALQAAGKRRMTAAEWLRGAPLRPGDRLGGEA